MTENPSRKNILILNIHVFTQVSLRMLESTLTFLFYGHFSGGSKGIPSYATRYHCRHLRRLSFSQPLFERLILILFFHIGLSAQVVPSREIISEIFK
jgi:hypothetical protein